MRFSIFLPSLFLILCRLRPASRLVSPPYTQLARPPCVRASAREPTAHCTPPLLGPPLPRSNAHQLSSITHHPSISVCTSSSMLTETTELNHARRARTRLCLLPQPNHTSRNPRCKPRHAAHANATPHTHAPHARARTWPRTTVHHKQIAKGCCFLSGRRPPPPSGAKD